MIKFANLWIFFLLPLPILSYYFLPKVKNNISGIRFPHYDLLKDFSENNFNYKNYFNLFLYFLCWILLLIATARPQWIGSPINFVKHGRDLMLAIDISGSMDERDMTQNYNVNRLDVVKYIATEFIEKRTDDRLGIILFGTKAYLYSPLSFDHQMITKLLQDTQIGFAGTYTAIGDAIGIAIKQLKKANNRELVLILLSDGGNTSGMVEPTAAAKIAAEQGIKIYTIGVGGASKGPSFMNHQNLDEKTLQEIANLTNGKYFLATNKENLQKIYDTINKLEPLGKDSITFRPIKDLFYWPLAITFVLSLILLINIKFKLFDRLYEHS